MNSWLRHMILGVVLLGVQGLCAQDKKGDEIDQKMLNKAENLTYEGNEEIVEKNFVTAEAKYREAISMAPDQMPSRFNLANTYYQQKSFDEAAKSYVKTTKVAKNETERHLNYHNLGNALMEQKNYAGAVEAYKNALRNNPNDDQTRYNLALAKKMQEQEQEKEDQNKDKDKDKDQDQEQDQDNKDNKDQNDQGDQKKDDQGDQQKGDDKEDENGDPKDQNQDQQDKEEQQQGDGEQKKEQPQQPNEQQPPRKSQLSPQQIQNLLEAMQNEEKKSKEKVDAQQVKGVPLKRQKDW